MNVLFVELQLCLSLLLFWRRIWFGLRLWLTNVHIPLCIFPSASLCSGHSDIFSSLYTSGPKEGIGCSAHLSLCCCCFCKAAHSWSCANMQVDCWLPLHWSLSLTRVPLQAPHQCRPFSGSTQWTEHRRWPISNLWVSLQFSSLGWATKSFSDSHIHPDNSCSTFELKIQEFDVLLLNFCSNFFFALLVWLAAFIGRGISKC